MALKYNEVMNKITVTDEMRRRILQNIADADFAETETARAPRSVYFSRWRESAALAACAALLVAGVLAVPSILDRHNVPQQAPVSSSQSVSQSSHRATVSASSKSDSRTEAASSSTTLTANTSSSSEVSLYSPAAPSSHASTQAASQPAASSATQSEATASQPQSAAESASSAASSVSESTGSSSQGVVTPDLDDGDDFSLWALLWPGSGSKKTASSSAPASSSTASTASSSEPVFGLLSPSSSQSTDESQIATAQWYATPDAAAQADDGYEVDTAQPNVTFETSTLKCDSRSELEQVTGFDVEGAKILPFSTVKAEYTASNWGGMAQITYTGAGGQIGRWRKCAGARNNSGVDIGKRETATFTCQGFEVTLAGAGEGYSLAWWTDGTYSWSLSLSKSLSRADWETLITRAHS